MRSLESRLPTFLILSAVAGAALLIAAAPRAHMSDTTQGRDPKGIAVIELFTSEGCSSCPPADRVLSEIAAEAKKSGTPVNTLAFHVDYWNNLGWPDRFSSPEATHRQKLYGAAFHSNRSYTPQMIVGGAKDRVEFVGSDGDRAKKEIKAAQTHAAADVKVKISPRRAGEKFIVDVSADPTIATIMDGKADVLIALTEDGLSTDVKKGENAGEHLKHDAVVRAFEVVALSKQGTAQVMLTAPSDIREANSHIIAVVQKRADLQVLGAAGVAVETSAAPTPSPQSVPPPSTPTPAPAPAKPNPK